MRLVIISVVAAAFTLVPALLSGQAVDSSVQGIDPTVASRVQDPDQPDNALLPGGSSAWTGQPIMSQTQSSGTSGPAQKGGSIAGTNQFPSLVGISTWGPSSSAAWAGNPIVSETASSGTPGSAQGAGSMGKGTLFQNLIGVSVWGSSPSTAASSLNASGAQGQGLSALRWNKAAGFRKLNLSTPTAIAETARSNRSEDEILDGIFSGAQNGSPNSNDKLRKLKQATAKSARLRVTNPFQSKSDASTAGLWGGDKSSARALAQQQHESGMLLQSGFSARSERRKHRRRGGLANAASHQP
jgi:hypothetical protein